MSEIRDTRVFDQRSQDDFAALSLDYNPKHVDPLRARNMFFGRQVVHGMHLALWALDRTLDSADLQSLAEIRCAFSEPCEPGLQIELSGRVDNCKATLEISTRGHRAARFVMSFGNTPPTPFRHAGAGGRPDVQLLEPTDIDGRAGSVPLTLDPAVLAALFPALAAKADPAQVALLLATTRLVGMECPGLNSIYTGLRLKFSDATTAPAFDYRVTYWNPVLRLLNMSVAARGVEGKIEAILHPPDVAQPSSAEVARSVTPGEFGGERALVIGGSRGLGETVAKIIAAGGGHSTIAYRSGAQDAHRVLSEITGAGASCDLLQLDVLAPAPLGDRDRVFDQIYYFATPRIRPDNALDDSDRAEYRAVYVEGACRLLDRLRGALAANAVFYYPSSVFADAPETDFRAYATAKRDGEIAIRAAAAAMPCRLVIDRLPRLRTGQSSALIGDDALETLPTMLDAVRRVTRARKENLP